jgi:hypothetical protein
MHGWIAGADGVRGRCSLRDAAAARRPTPVAQHTAAAAAAPPRPLPLLVPSRPPVSFTRTSLSMNLPRSSALSFLEPILFARALAAR